MKLLGNAVMVLALVGLMGVAARADEVPKEVPKGQHLLGLVVKVSDDGAKVTVKAGTDAAAKEVAVKVGENTVITVDGKAAKVADLKAGMFVIVTPAEGTAEKIVARTPPPSGAR
jgi:ABC-type sugar transport system substrate-binding protein